MIPEGLRTFLTLDAPALAAGMLAAAVCALLGNFLVLRRLSLMGDAISHSVLPGLVAAFLLAGTRATWPMFIGAAAAGLVTVALVEAVRRFARIEPGAAMGVVFSIFFALGVVLINQADHGNVDLDPDCVLHGQLEYVTWNVPAAWRDLASMESLGRLPRQVTTLGCVLAISLVLVVALFKELRIAAFDPILASSMGMRPTLVNALFMTAVAGAVVASFEAVGSILVIAMLICPPAAARLLTDRLVSQLLVSVGIALVCAVAGYLLAATAPVWLGVPAALSASGMIGVATGAALTLAIVASPRHGIVARSLRRVRLSVQIAREDLLAELYRREEAGTLGAPLAPPIHSRRIHAKALRRARARGEVAGPMPSLTATGRDVARGLIRTHRLLESYLVDRAGLRADHVHRSAMELEHFVPTDMLEAEHGDRSLDPHDKQIPPGPPPPPPPPPRARERS